MKRALSIGSGVIVVFLTLITLCFVFLIMLSFLGLNRESGLLGFRMYKILSDSMRGEFLSGDIVFSRRVNTESLRENDIITFRSADPDSYGLVITHRIVGITADNSFITRGDANNVPDTTPVPATNVLGRYLFKIPKMGYLIDFFYRPVGYVIMVLIPFAVFAVLSGSKFLGVIRDAVGKRPKIIVEQQYKEEENLEDEPEAPEQASNNPSEKQPDAQIDIVEQESPQKQEV